MLNFNIKSFRIYTELGVNLYILAVRLITNYLFTTMYCIKMEPKRVLAEVTNKNLENPKESVKESHKEQTKQ